MYRESLSAGVPISWNITGRHFRLVETVGPVTITFYRRGAEISEAIDVEAGYSEWWPETAEGFDKVEISSATAQTVKFAIRTESRVEYDRAVGNVAVTNNRGAMNQSNPNVGTAAFSYRPTNPNRQYLFIQNLSDVADMWLNLTAAVSVGNGIKIPPGGYIEFQGFVPIGSVSMISTVANEKAYIMEGPY